MPEVYPIFDKIKELRSKHEKGLLPEDTDAFLSMAELASKYGFKYEEHTVVTEDGYELLLGRIPGVLGEDSTNGPKPAIILQHGLGVNMMQWVFNTNDTTHAYVLARSGYDVWMGNNRGTRFGKSHVTLDPKKDKAFW